MKVSDTIKTATLSHCGRFRWHLGRRDPNGVGRILAFALCNPSTADGKEDDPTVRRAWDFTESHGYDEMYFVNVNPVRATDPSLQYVPSEDVLRSNDAQLLALYLARVPIVCAWGDKALPVLVARARVLLRKAVVYKLGTLTAKGQPRHPLYLPKVLRMERWLP